jgi:glucose/arabinose dehydrogenase
LPVVCTGTQPTTISLEASTTTPSVGGSVTFTATLRSDGTAFQDQPVTIYHYFNGVKYTDITTNTNAAGKITLTQTLSATGQRTYYATFAGDSTHASSTSSAVNVRVGIEPASLKLEASTTTPPAGGSVTFTATLTSDGTLLQDKSVRIYHYFNNVQYNDTTTKTNNAGKITLTQSFSSTGQRTYYATFAADGTYVSATSSAVVINVGITQIDLKASPTATPTVGQSVTFTATLKSGDALLSGKSVTIYHYFNNVRYTDTTKTTASGQITLTQSFSSTGQRTYYATFAGDTAYTASTSSAVAINVK